MIFNIFLLKKIIKSFKYKIVMNRRIFFLLLTLLLFGIEVSIALFVKDNYVRPYVGDMLVVILIYCFIRIFIPRGVKLLPLYVFLFACVIEWMQYLNIVERMSLSENKVASTVIGTSFDWKDIICYAVGCLLIFGVEKLKIKF